VSNASSRYLEAPDIRFFILDINRSCIRHPNFTFSYKEPIVIKNGHLNKTKKTTEIVVLLLLWSAALFLLANRFAESNRHLDSYGSNTALPQQTVQFRRAQECETALKLLQDTIANML
jgi:hypothetical protein